jgi:hypothetical protein
MVISIRKVELCRKKREELCATKEEDLQQCSARRRAETQALASHGFAEAASSHRVGRHNGAGGSIPGHAAAGCHSRRRDPRSPSGTASSRSLRHPLDSPSAEESVVGGRDRELPRREPRCRIRPPRPSLASLRGGGEGRLRTETGQGRRKRSQLRGREGGRSTASSDPTTVAAPFSSSTTLSAGGERSASASAG